MAKFLLCGILSQFLFASLYLFSLYLQPLSGTSIFAWRMLLMCIALALIILFIFPQKSFTNFLTIHLGRSLKKWALMLLGSALLASQLWLFMWAPINEEGVNVAMGYFLFPLMMVLAGRFIWKEQLSTAQWIAVALALIGVSYELLSKLTFSWATLWVALMYPPYYLSRRAMAIPALLGLFFDTLIIAPFCLIYLSKNPQELHLILEQPHCLYLLPLLGLTSTLALFLNFLANRHLPINIFGLLSYLEPALLFLCAIFILKDGVEKSAYISYSFIWAGLLILGTTGLYKRNLLKI